MMLLSWWWRRRPRVEIMEKEVEYQVERLNGAASQHADKVGEIKADREKTKPARETIESILDGAIRAIGKGDHP